MNPTTEHASAHAMSAVSVGAAHAVSEGAHAEGIYHGVCRGYKEQFAKDYLHHFPRLVAMREKRDQLLRGTQIAVRGTLDKFLVDLADFEQFMANMTEVKWDSYAPNVVVTVGKNLALDTILAGSGYTVVGPYMGLIGAVSYTGVPVAADTMASHATWTEAGGTNAPTYTGPRKTVAWSAASAGSKSPSTAPVYTMTGTGTVKGVFLCFGTGAVSTLDSTAGVLLSAGLFTGGDQAVVSTNTVTVTYALSM